MTGKAKVCGVVEWSEEDQCYIGYWPGIIGPCCHGDEEDEILGQLLRIVDEWAEIESKDKRGILPSSTAT